MQGSWVWSLVKELRSHMPWSKITAVGDCSHEIKRCLRLGIKSYDQSKQHIKKQGHYFANKGPSSQGYGFSSDYVWMWELDCEESWRIDAFELWCRRRLLRVPWTSRRSNQSILKEISPEYSLEGLMLKMNTLATWCEELTHWKTPWCWERLKTRGEGNSRGWDGWTASPIQQMGTLGIYWRWWGTGRPGVLRFMGLQRVEHNWVTELTDCF